MTEAEEYDTVNAAVMRFIRGTLAMNVQAFVRSIVHAKVLWERLEHLYGEKAGIEEVGGRYGEGLGERIGGLRGSSSTSDSGSEGKKTSPLGCR